MLNKIFKLFWFNGENKDFIVDENSDITFELSLGNLIIGSLSFYEGLWHFEYSEDFKKQSHILPLVNFPNKNKEYVNQQLWPFFASRIPSLAQRQNKHADNNVETLLKLYGRNVINNPYVLSPVLANS